MGRAGPGLRAWKSNTRAAGSRWHFGNAIPWVRVRRRWGDGAVRTGKFRRRRVRNTNRVIPRRIPCASTTHAGLPDPDPDPDPDSSSSVLKRSAGA
ncbi:LOW QUALITY PROTEIN: hypothetical protein U9M48_009737 [Paspalum notatum var. saurae]|uniref:Uncharacterized protein n=1 Tax=Paspalum notatum var. saurae TaxID=547442 RepID=A0AAQ3WF95_PASNO